MLKVEKYKAHIDGLRAIAVIGVVLFHLDFDFLKGGFVGVDVFFVISGYLITHKIFYEFEKKGTFNFYSFYKKRFKRLFPALLFTIALAFVIGALLYSPNDFENLSGSAFYATLGLSNFFFWIETGYFDTAAITKPLLHTWSLAVEEQFYLIWPVLIYICLRFFSNFKLIFLFFVFSFSFYLNYDFFYKDSFLMKNIFPDFNFTSSSAYFLTPFRVFEFTIGAFIVFIEGKIKHKSIINNFFTLVGVLLIVYSMLYFNENTIFPFYNALYPVFGAVLIIFFGTGSVSRHLLENRFMLFIGLISYSFYLIHWPLIVFYKYLFGNDIAYIEKTSIFLVIIVISYFMYRFIETPFRTNRKASSLYKNISLGIISIFILMSSYYAWNNNGLPERLPDNLEAIYLERKEVNESFNSLTHRDLNFNFTNVDSKKIIIIGDSFGKDLINIFKKTEFYEDVELIYRGLESSCQPMFNLKLEVFKENINQTKFASCKKQYRELNDSVTDISKADTIFLAAAWKEWSIQYIDDIVYNLREYNERAKIVVVGRKELKQHVYRSILKPFPINEYSVSKIDVHIDEYLKSKSNESGYKYMSFYDKFCTMDYSCYPFDDDKLPMIFDYAHLNERGAKHFSKLIRDDLLMYLNN